MGRPRGDIASDVLGYLAGLGSGSEAKVGEVLCCDLGTSNGIISYICTIRYLLEKKRNLHKVMLGTNILAIVNPGAFPRDLLERLHEKLSAPSSSRTPGILVATNHCDAGEV